MRTSGTGTALATPLAFTLALSCSLPDTAVALSREHYLTYNSAIPNGGDVKR